MVSMAPIQAYTVTSEELQKEKEELEKKKKEAQDAAKKEQANLDAANSKASAIAGDMDEKEAEIEETNEALVQTLASIDMINDEIADNEDAIKITEGEYEQAKATEDEQYSTMKLRIKYMYERGNFTYMQILMESANFSDMMNKAEYIEKLYDYDRRLLEEYKAAVAYTNEVLNQLEDEKAELEASKFELTEEQNYLDSLLAEQEAEYGSYEAQLAAAQKEVSAFKSKVNAQNNAVKKLEQQAQSKQKEIDAAKKREEEERKAAEEAARKAAEEAANASKSSNSGSSTSTGSSSSSYTVPTGSSSSGSKSYKSPSEFGGSTGERMAQYAVQFVGNPYVFGGTSLTNGADCSGFVQTVYKDFGYRIPRTGMINYGVGVSYEEAQPGDVFCYAGHVALYIGDGKIVHASTARTGIRISNANYKTWLGIRRFI